MASGKKSFVLYSDLIHTVNKMPREKAGDLFIHILQYVNDLNPETDDLIVQLTFEPIKQQLKRDLEAWESELDKKSTGGVIGNLKRWHKDIYRQFIRGSISLEDAIKLADKNKKSDTDSKQSLSEHNQSLPIASIAVNVNDNVNVIKSNIEERKLKFASTLKPFTEIYDKTMLNDFYKYWTEPNKSNSKFKQELEKTWDLSRRLETWAKNDKSFTKTETKQPQRS